MPEISVVVGVLGIVIQLTGYAQYFYQLFWKKTAKPHAFSWGIWSFLMGIGAFAQISEGEILGTIPLLQATLCAAIVAGTAIFRNEIVFTKSDWIFFSLALFAIPLWILTKTPLYSVLLISCIDGIMLIPTIRKTWNNPFSEPLGPYIASGIAFFLSLFLLQNISMITAFYPIAIICINLFFIALVLFRRKVHKTL